MIDQEIKRDVDICMNEDRTGCAVFSPCRKYRYVLWRNFQKTLFAGDKNVVERACVFLMLNPSTADHNILDNTVRMCCHHAKRWNFESLYVVNLFAYRATEPKDMKAQQDPIGKLNNDFVKEMVTNAALTVLACGNHAIHNDRHEFINELPQDKLYYFVKNAPQKRLKRDDGGGEYPAMPKHPLYVKKKADLFRWSDDSLITHEGIQEL